MKWWEEKGEEIEKNIVKDKKKNVWSSKGV